MAKWNETTAKTAENIAEDDRTILADMSAASGSRDGYMTRANARRAFHQILVSQTAHGFSVGECVQHDGTDWDESLADTAANAVVVGLVVSVPDVDSFVMQLAADVTGLSGLTAGEVYYLQDAGGLGTSAGTVTVPVLQATSATTGVMILGGVA